MWLIAGEESDLYWSLASYLTERGINFAHIRVGHHPDGELKFYWPKLSIFAHATVLVQLPVGGEAKANCEHNPTDWDQREETGWGQHDETDWGDHRGKVRDTSRHQRACHQTRASEMYISALSLSREILEHKKKDCKRTASPASPLIVCCPYLPYAQNSYLLDALMSGVELATIDAHNSHDTRIHNLYPAQLFADKVREICVRGSVGEDVRDCFVFAPDNGALWRARQIAEALGAPLLTARKQRYADDSCSVIIAEDQFAYPSLPTHSVSPVYPNPPISSTSPTFFFQPTYPDPPTSLASFVLSRDVHKTCIIVDDIISSGNTINAAIGTIKGAGIQRIILVITHKILEDISPIINQVDAFITTNTLGLASKGNEHPINIVPFMVEKLEQKRRHSIKN
ncbi:MAG: hypothetical protein LBQ43_05025 [Holosporales bacterium]|jgi:phosphoribosylpyrophosphate synthetase|nr:hypothetical protein [Holosporales bacterium]